MASYRDLQSAGITGAALLESLSSLCEPKDAGAQEQALFDLAETCMDSPEARTELAKFLRATPAEESM